MQERFERRILEGVRALAATCQKRAHSPVDRAQRVGKLLGRNARAASCGGGVLQFSECPTAPRVTGCSLQGETALGLMREVYAMERSRSAWQRGGDPRDV